jgi:uncharacterized protein (TIGR01777 family)
MHIAVSGASGFVGSALISELVRDGHQVMRLVRRPAAPGAPELCWDPAGGPKPSLFEGLDAVVHLAGENIAGRWNDEKKRQIRESRVQGTRMLADSLAIMVKPPRVVVMASAIGYYGDRGDELLQEESGPGQDFLAQVARDWEAAAEPAERAGIRVVKLRIGVVLAQHGGALPRMLTPFKLGVGGKIGSGRQYWSWITLADLVGAIRHALATDSLRGPVNAVAPEPVRNADFTQALGRALHRPTIFPMPAFAARLALGEMADALLLSSARVDASKLAASGYNFRHPQLQPALADILR